VRPAFDADELGEELAGGQRRGVALDPGERLDRVKPLGLEQLGDPVSPEGRVEVRADQVGVPGAVDPIVRRHQEATIRVLGPR
jgi:hypothetical protein